MLVTGLSSLEAGCERLKDACCPESRADSLEGVDSFERALFAPSLSPPVDVEDADDVEDPRHFVR